MSDDNDIKSNEAKLVPLVSSEARDLVDKILWADYSDSESESVGICGIFRDGMEPSYSSSSGDFDLIDMMLEAHQDLRDDAPMPTIVHVSRAVCDELALVLDVGDLVRFRGDDYIVGRVAQDRVSMIKRSPVYPPLFGLAPIEIKVDAGLRDHAWVTPLSAMERST